MLIDLLQCKKEAQEEMKGKNAAKGPSKCNAQKME